jgi:hypothetical protein
MADVELVVTDLDGTFWFRDGDLHEQVHETTLDAWRELEARGVAVLIATGRRITSTRDPLARLGLAPPAVVMNGALVLDLATDARVHRHHYPSDLAADVLAAFRAAGVEPCIYVEHDDVDVFVGDRPSTHPEHLVGLATTVAEHPLDAVVADVPVFMFGLMGHDEGPLLEVQRALAGAAEVHVAPDQYGGHSCTVAPLGLSKWVGVEAYCAHAGIDPSRVLAIGDGPNDRELLDGAAVAVVPADAHESLEGIADHVVPTPRDGGWATLLDLV